jgi:uncharacterized membrane protein YedE/YeeE
MVERLPWYVAGPLIGMVIVVLRAAVNRPLGALGGYIDIADNARDPRRLGFRAFLLFGTILGGALFTLSSGTFALSWSYERSGILPADPAWRLAALGLAGVVMGIGARTAGGCTSGHGLSGMAAGSRASIASCITFFGVAVLLAHLWALGGAR